MSCNKVASEVSCASVLMTLLVAVPLLANAADLASGSSAGPMGRLFFTPAQRADLDSVRTAGELPVAAAGEDAGTTSAQPEPVVLSGVLTRRGSPAVVWVNGERARSRGNDVVRVQGPPDGRQRVPLATRNGQGSARLKPGQAWDPRTGAVSECLGCRATPAPATNVTPAASPPAIPAVATPGAAAPATAATTTGG
jgi:hypothetical protein